jgi:hypothetical protein
MDNHLQVNIASNFTVGEVEVDADQSVKRGRSAP